VKPQRQRNQRKKKKAQQSKYHDKMHYHEKGSNNTNVQRSFISFRPEERRYLPLTTTTDRPEDTQSPDIDQRKSMHQTQYTREDHISNSSSNTSTMEKPENKRHQRPDKDQTTSNTSRDQTKTKKQTAETAEKEWQQHPRQTGKKKIIKT